MSYDLYLYKRKDQEISKDQISEYLSNQIPPANEEATQWIYENKDTEVYFSFEYNEPDQGEIPDEDIEPIEDFDNTNLSFYLNFMRPAFFGNEAFRFLEQFCKDLDLFILNPQSDVENPYRPNEQEQFAIWNKTNLWASKDHFNPAHTCYLSQEKCFAIWEYNFNRQQLQQKLGDGYFVPRVFFFKQQQNNEPFTLTTWTDHIPTVLPNADYILLTRQYTKFFRTVKDTVLVSRAELLDIFADYFDKFDFPDCLIIHPEKARGLAKKFNSIKAKRELAAFGERLPMENLYNAKPE